MKRWLMVLYQPITSPQCVTLFCIFVCACVHMSEGGTYTIILLLGISLCTTHPAALFFSYFACRLSKIRMSLHQTTAEVHILLFIILTTYC